MKTLLLKQLLLPVQALALLLVKMDFNWLMARHTVRVLGRGNTEFGPWLNFAGQIHSKQHKARWSVLTNMKPGSKNPTW